ncbi:hypothetical protein GCM10018780_80200 [Streptomyces lanatus]|nr:hypothetical protein GCM10018780_80200 [Streptomyces lanatus]
MRETGRSLMGGLHGELGGDAHAVPGPRLKMQPVGLLAATAETLAVVRAEKLTGSGSIRMPHRFHGVGRGL